MNRQQRRQLTRRSTEAGQIDPDDAEAQVQSHLAAGTAEETVAEEPVDTAYIARAAVAPSRHRTGPRQFLHEVNSEMRKVAWPTRAETLNYSTVVLVTLALLMGLIFGLDLAFNKAANFLFNP